MEAKLTLIWNWTHRLYESWHLHMRKLHMGDQSFSLTWAISTFIDLRVSCLPADTFLIHTGHTLQGPSWKDALQTPGLNLRLLHGLGSRIWGGKCSHLLHERVHRSVHADQSHSDGYTRAQGASAASPSSSFPPGWWNSNKLKLLPAEV